MNEHSDAILNGACTDLPDPKEKLVPILETSDGAKLGEVIDYLKGEEFPFWIKAKSPAADSSKQIQLLVYQKHTREAVDLLNRWDYLWRGVLRPIEFWVQPKTDLWGQINRICLPILWILIVVLPFGYKNYLLFPAVVCVGILVWVPGYAFRLRLRRLGYEWPTTADANRILWYSGLKARILPPASDVEVIPGSVRDSEFIICFLNQYAEYKNSAKWRRKSIH